MADSELDKNKTTLTHNITGLAMAYLSGSGFKPVETEVPVAHSWIADVASFISPTRTELKKLTINYRFTSEEFRREYPNEDARYLKIAYRYGHILTAIVEVKTSRADFSKDLKSKFSNLINPAHFLFLAYPSDMLKDDEIPFGWIGLKCSADGSKLIKRVKRMFNRDDYLFEHMGMIHPQPVGDIADFVAAVAVRRHHRTAYSEMRAMLKSWRASDGEKKAMNRKCDIVRTIVHRLKGESYYKDRSLKQLLETPDYMDKDLEYLEGLINAKT